MALSRTVGKSTSSDATESPFRSLIPYFIGLWVLIFWARFFLTVLPNNSTADLQIDRVDILLEVPGILWGHLFSPAGGNQQGGWINLVQRVPIAGCALWILLAAFSIGRLVLRQLNSVEWADHSAYWAFAGGLGLSLLSLMTLVLGKAGLLFRSLFFVLLTGCILLEVWASARRRSVQFQRDSSGRLASRKGLLVGCVLFLLPMLLGAMLPSVDFDVKEYHLEGPKEYFLAGSIHFLPHNVYTSFPFLTEMLSLCGMVLMHDWFSGALVGKTVLMAFAPLTALAVYSLGNKIAGQQAGGIAALIYLSTPWIYRISIIAYTEGALCCYVILSLLALIRWMERLQLMEGKRFSDQPLTLLCGLCAGSAVATKYPGMVLVAIPVGLTMLIALLMNRKPLSGIIRTAAVYVIGILLTFGPWMAKNALETGNPVYPLMYSVFGGADWNAELNEKWKQGHARPSPLLKKPLAMWNELRQNVIDVTLRSDWQSPLMFGLAPLAFLYPGKRRSFWITVGAGTSILLVWYTLTHLIDRFWVPVLPIVAVLSGVACVSVKTLLTGRDQLAVNSLGGTGLWIWRGIQGLMAVTLVYNFTFMTIPASGYNAYFADYQQARLSVKPGSVQLAENVPGETGKVLFVGEAMVFDAECAYRYNTVFDHSLLEQWTAREVRPGEWKLRTEQEIRERFRKEGITHVLVNWNEILRYRTTYGYTDYVSPARIEALENLGVFVEVPIPEAYNLRDWASLPDSWQDQILRWGPELKLQTYRGELKMQQYQLFQVVISR